MQFSKEDILEISKMLAASEFANIEVKTGDWEIRIYRDGAVKGDASGHPGNENIVTEPPKHIDPPTSAVNTSGTDGDSNSFASQHAQADDDTFLVSSPILGTFYESPQPGAAPFVKEGDRVQAGDTLCLIEVMKTYTDVVAEQSGRIAKILIKNGSMVESGQSLFVIELD